MINYRVFETPQDVVVSLADTMMAMSKQVKPVHISLSGGSTPKLLFKTLAQAPYAKDVNWSNLHFWWGDERCVEPTDPESNFGEANELLFQQIDIPAGNIHRIKGEDDPAVEVVRFAEEMDAEIPLKNGLPAFDWILLGMGTDGHTASLFPNQTDFDDPELSVIATHPDSGQKRISKTARLLENADRITYLVLGESKAEVLQEINNTPAEALAYPAAKIKAVNGKTEWFLDSAAAKLLAQGE
ncbi:MULTISPECIES: 6-phosphogluconolactonase [unclassified Photobacterium]|uniref:6-phosphogluconolactonase n=1 Tax=unclassified Photobacterium TaxID=2628852 RepID=UPI000D159E25|nr:MULTISPECIES: 6-phosphogluconolactonase [unclassified Photobacterium]PSV32566.1 6-phosphogluconolactonase [Photobacterium sp. GB-72]PSV38733.1 6-phosphogluconolactonase [Photobacterium sp. GB-27]PSV40089.1 6-phosphogluconolactonase [Photobacterium sp. GB-210]PSV54523.1 6-phosphogluconolactonase [Photobacterium sp. GB-1]PSW74961.1 6-phosphogluconolactonase [Photobacterium sp. GB-50]